MLYIVCVDCRTGSYPFLTTTSFEKAVEMGTRIGVVGNEACGLPDNPNFGAARSFTIYVIGDRGLPVAHRTFPLSEIKAVLDDTYDPAVKYA